MTVCVKSENGFEAEVEIADDFWDRLKGLMFRKEFPQGTAMLFSPCSSIHTCFMRFPIDVVYLDRNNIVLKKETVYPWRIGSFVKGTRSILELNKDAAENLKVGNQLDICFVKEKGGRNMSYGQANDFKQEMGSMFSNSMEGLTSKDIQTELASKLQNTVVGGYAKKSVEEYALDMKHNLMLIKMQLEQQIRELTAEKVSVTQECQVIRNQLNTAEEKLNEVVKQKESAKQEARMSADKLNECMNQYSDYEDMKLQKKQYEEELSKKREDISRLNEQLSQYEQAYKTLQAKMKDMEANVQMASGDFPYQEMDKLRKQKEEAEEKCKELLENMKKDNLNFEKELAARTKEEEQQALIKERKKWEKQFDDLNKQYEEQENYKQELEEKVDVLYKNYEENASRMKKQEQRIEEKELLLKHFQQQEQEAILMGQENEKLKETIDSLKETIRMIIGQMETQSESMNLYIERTNQERATLKKVIGEQASLKLQNVELLDIQRELVVQIEDLKSQNIHLEKGLDKQKKVSLPIEREKRQVLPEKQPLEDAAGEVSDPELDTCDKAMQKAMGLFSVMEGENAKKIHEVKNIG